MLLLISKQLSSYIYANNLAKARQSPYRPNDSAEVAICRLSHSPKNDQNETISISDEYKSGSQESEFIAKSINKPNRKFYLNELVWNDLRNGIQNGKTLYNLLYTEVFTLKNTTVR